MDRRAALKLLLAAGGAASAAGACRSTAEKQDVAEMNRDPFTGRMPAIFLAHGSPFLLDDAAWLEELRRWGEAMPRPSAVLMLSAHWLDAPLTIGATRAVPLVYDFYNFPEKYYRVTYPAPGAPALARRIEELLGGASAVAHDPERGLDHGAYVPLIGMFPSADVPVLQVSFPTMDPAALLELGRALAPLRREGVLIVGSGFLTHNLRALSFRGDMATPAWATEFDAWTADVLARQDVDALVQYKSRAPGVKMALPTHEHFIPVLVAAGAAIDEAGPVTFPITGFAYGSFTRRSVQYG